MKPRILSLTILGIDLLWSISYFRTSGGWQLRVGFNIAKQRKDAQYQEDLRRRAIAESKRLSDLLLRKP